MYEQDATEQVPVVGYAQHWGGFVDDDQTQQWSPEEKQPGAWAQGWERGKQPGSEITWPKAFVIVGVTIVVGIVLVTILALMVLPPEFWMAP